MNSLKKNLLVSLLFLLNIHVILSQDFVRGFIFSNKGDTIPGYVENWNTKNLISTCLFKPTNADNPIFLKPSEIAGFGYRTGGLIFFSVKFHFYTRDTTAFLQLYYKGTYDLFYFETSTVKQFIIRKSDGSVIAIIYPGRLTAHEILDGYTSEIKFREEISKLFMDTPELPALKNVNPTVGSLVALFGQHDRYKEGLINFNQLERETNAFNENRSVLNLPSKDYKSGFVLNEKGDTLKGFVYKPDLKSPLNFCFFRPALDPKVVNFKASELSGFGFYNDEILYTSRRVSFGNADSLIFLRKVFAGSYNLLFFESKGEKHFFIENPDRSLSDISLPYRLGRDDYLKGLNAQTVFRNRLESAFSKIPLSTGKIKPELYSILAFMKSFHQKAGEQYKIYDGNKPVLNFGLTAGIKFQEYQLVIKNGTFKSFFDPVPYAGICLNLTESGRSTGFTFRNTLEFQSFSYSYLQKSESSSVYNNETLKTTSNTSYAAFVYTPVKYLYIEAGPVLDLMLNPKIGCYRDQVFSDIIFSSYIENRPGVTTLAGLSVNAGYPKRLKNGMLLRLSGGYDYMIGPGRRLQSIDFSLSCLFKK